MVNGDISKEDLGISKEDRQMIIEHCNVIIHSAADITFDKPFQHMMNFNYLASMRLLDLLRECKNFEVYNFVSSIGANLTTSNTRKLTKEKLYNDLPYSDPDKTIREIMALPPDVAQAKQKEYIKHHVNYSFSKNMFEKSLTQNHGEVPSIISRAAVIANSYLEPYPSYIDSVQSY